MKIYEFMQRDIVTAKNQSQSSIYVSEADTQPNMSRRGFLGGLGKAAAAGAAVGMGLAGANAQAQANPYETVRNNIFRAQASLGGYLDYCDEKKMLNGNQVNWARHAANNRNLRPFSIAWNSGIDEGEDHFKLLRANWDHHGSQANKKKEQVINTIKTLQSQFTAMYAAAESLISNPQLLNNIAQWAAKNESFVNTTLFKGPQSYPHGEKIGPVTARDYIEDTVLAAKKDYEQRNHESDTARAAQSTRRRGSNDNEQQQQQQPSREDLQRFVMQLRNLIKSNTRFSGNIEGNPRAEFMVSLSPNGDVQSVTLHQTSGNERWDEIAKRAIALSTPFPQFPGGFPKVMRISHQPYQ